MYSFVVSDQKNIDFDRVAREQLEDGHPASLIVIRDKKYLLIADEFLSKFSSCNDKVYVLGKRLCAFWGDCVKTIGVTQYTIANAQIFRVPDDYDVAEIKRDLARASEYVRRIRVNVHTML